MIESKIEQTLENYTKKDAQTVRDTIFELCRHGVGNGCYQSTRVLTDILTILTIVAEYVEEKE